MRHRLTPLPTQCVFCDSPDLTREHVWPEWMRSFVPRPTKDRPGHAVSHRRVDPGTGKIVNRLLRGRLHRNSRPFGTYLPVVCGICNTGWMSRLQTDAKPMLQQFLMGRRIALSSDQQLVLAAWVAMFTMVVEFADVDTAVTPRGHRFQFAKDRIPPRGWTIWIGHMGGALGFTFFNHFSCTVGLPPACLPLHSNMQATGFKIGSLFVQTYSVLPPLPQMPEADRSAFADCFGLRCLWPLRGLVLAPPSCILDASRADAISRAFIPAEMQADVRPLWETP